MGGGTNQTTKDYSSGSVLKKAISNAEDKLVISVLSVLNCNENQSYFSQGFLGSSSSLSMYLPVIFPVLQKYILQA